MRNRHFTVKTTARLVALCLGLALLLSACAEQAGSSASESGRRFAVWPGDMGPVHSDPLYVADTTLTIWILFDAPLFEYLINPNQLSKMRNANLPRDYAVDVQYGVIVRLPNGPITFPLIPPEKLEEAKRLLITELMAGMGPDIIVMDGMNARDFAASGALMDLSGVAAEAGVYESLVESLRVDGALPYIPFNMSAPLMLGNPAYMGEVSGFAGLAASMAGAALPPWPGVALEERHAGGIEVPLPTPGDPLWVKQPPLPEAQRALFSLLPLPRDLWGNYAGYTHAEALYLPFLIGDGYMLDTALLEEYYTAVKQILDANQAVGGVWDATLNITFPGNGSTISMGPSFANWYLGNAHLAFVGADSRYYYNALPAIAALARNLPLDVRPFPAPGKVWQPDFLIAVNRNTKNTEEALHFVQTMLSDELQLPSAISPGLHGSGNGFGAVMPVTQSAVAILQQQFAQDLGKEYFRSEMIYERFYLEEGYDMAWMEETGGYPYDVDALMRSFDTAYLPDPLLRDAVAQNLAACLEGTLTPAEAARQCETDLALYLAERR